MKKKASTISSEPKKRKVSPAGARQKGLQFERYIANRLGHIFPEAERNLEFQASAAQEGQDIKGTDRIKIQAKCHQNYVSIGTIREIQVRDESDIPVLVTKGNRMDAMAVLPFEKFVTLLEIAYGLSLPFRTFPVPEALPNRHKKIEFLGTPVVVDDNLPNNEGRHITAAEAARTPLQSASLKEVNLPGGKGFLLPDEYCESVHGVHLTAAEMNRYRGLLLEEQSFLSPGEVALSDGGSAKLPVKIPMHEMAEPHIVDSINTYKKSYGFPPTHLEVPFGVKHILLAGAADKDMWPSLANKFYEQPDSKNPDVLSFMDEVIKIAETSPEDILSKINHEKLAEACNEAGVFDDLI